MEGGVDIVAIQGGESFVRLLRKSSGFPGGLPLCLAGNRYAEIVAEPPRLVRSKLPNTVADQHSLSAAAHHVSKMQHAELTILEHVSLGDKEAFAVLVRRFQDRLYRLLNYTVNSAELAEDIARQAFVQAYRQARQFEREGDFYPGLCRFAMQSLSDRRAVPRSVRIDQPSVPAPHPSRRESNPAALRLRQLPTAFRQVLVLRELEQFDYATIAAILGVPRETVAIRLARARRYLRQLEKRPTN